MQRPEVQEVTRLIKEQIFTRYPWAHMAGMVAWTKARSYLAFASWSRRQLWLDLRALHVNLGWEEASSLNGNLEGNFSLQVQRGSRWEELVELSVGLLRRTTDNRIALQKTPRGDQMTIEVLFGDSRQAADATEVA